MFGDVKQFLDTWEWESQKTLELLQALPASQYDLRPDPKGRSLGELAWHLAEVEAYMSYSVEKGFVDFNAKPAGERPRTIEGIVAGYPRVHAESVARIQKLSAAYLARTIKFFDGSDMKIGMVLSGPLLRHLIHHRGQLILMCRLAGARPPGIYGPNRETLEELRAAGR